MIVRGGHGSLLQSACDGGLKTKSKLSNGSQRRQVKREARKSSKSSTTTTKRNVDALDVRCRILSYNMQSWLDAIRAIGNLL